MWCYMVDHQGKGKRLLSKRAQYVIPRKTQSLLKWTAEELQKFREVKKKSWCIILLKTKYILRAWNQKAKEWHCCRGRLQQVFSREPGFNIPSTAIVNN